MFKLSGHRVARRVLFASLSWMRVARHPHRTLDREHASGLATAKVALP